MGIFLSWFQKADKTFSGGAFPELHCRDLNHRQTPTATFWRQEHQGKNVHKVPPLSFDEVVDRFTPEIVALVDVLPLEEETIDSVIMPVIRNLIMDVHLLPASEVHHHCGIGGLLVHSLQTARFAVQRIDQMVPSREMTPQMRYSRKHLMPVVAALGMLLHDCGKVKDMAVVNEDGQEWCPDTQPLTQWLKDESYFVYWRPDREHNRHVLVSLRLAYSRLLTKAAYDYLLKNGAMSLFDSMMAAVVHGTGDFADVCKLAEAESIEMEKRDRRKASTAGVRVSVPLVTLILRSMKTLIREGEWKINSAVASVFATDEGVFLCIDEKWGSQIRSAAIRTEGASQVPGTTESVLQVLEDAGVIDVGDESQGREFWKIRVQQMSTPDLPCVKFLGQLHELLADGESVPLLEAHLDGGTVTVHLLEQEREEHLTEAEVLEKAGSVSGSCNGMPQRQGTGIDVEALRAPEGRFLEGGKVKHTKKEERADEVVLLQEDELLGLTRIRLDDQDCKNFCLRLVKTAVWQLRSGRGALVSEGVTTEGAWLIASSVPFEAVLDRHGIDVFAFQTIFRLFREDYGFLYNDTDHTIRVTKSEGDK